MATRSKSKSAFYLTIVISFSLLLVACSRSTSAPNIVVLYTEQDPIIPNLPPNCCRYISLEKYKEELPQSAHTVILGGHGQAPEYAGYNFEEVAEAITAFSPQLIVMNSCYGATTDILGALVKRKSEAYIVAAAFRIYKPGFTFEPAFFSGTLEEQLQAVNTEPKYPLLRWKLNAADLARVEKQTRQMSPVQLRKSLQRIQPALVRIAFPSPSDPDAHMLVPLSPERFK